MNDPTSITESQPEPNGLSRLPLAARWLLLIVVSGVLAAALETFDIPAAMLLGPMAGGVFFAVNGARMSVSGGPYLAAQAVIGCLIANLIDPGIVTMLAADWTIFLSIVLAIIAASSLMGYAMARTGVLPGSTAVWGTSAGGASAMLVMADAFGADARLVAFMQYMRVISVTSIASAVAAFFFHTSGGAGSGTVWLAPVDWPNLATTLLAAFAGSGVGALSKIPSGALLAPMIVTIALKLTGMLTIELPPWLLAIAYALLGWRIGLGFSRRLLRHAASVLPHVLGSIAVLISFCAVLAYLLNRYFGIDALSAYLATSPGGLDTVAIIAASTPVNVPFVMALQTARLMLIMALGPWIARWVARSLPE